MTLQFQVPTIVCEGCAETISKAIKTLDAGASVTVDLPSKTVTVESQTDENALKEAITLTGHTVA